MKASQFDATNDPIKLRRYNSMDVAMTSHLEQRCEERLAETHRGRELFDSYTSLQVIADEMTWRGVKVDQARRTFHHHQLRTRMGKMAKVMVEIAGTVGLHTFNPNKIDDWRTLFFAKFKVQPTKWSDITHAPSLDEEALTPLIVHPNPLVCAAARAGLRYRKWGTLDRNHVRGLRLDLRSVCHPFWRPTGTIGQRWSGSRPNPHNVPKPMEERGSNGKRITIHGGLRDMFIPQTEKGWMVEADAKQIEFRIASFLSGDKPTLEVIQAYDEGRGPDPHTVRAIELFGISGREPTKRERTLSKNFIYGGILYGGTAETLHAVLSVDTPIELSLVQRMIDRYLNKHPALVNWHRQLVKDANEKGYVEEPLSGRRRHFWSRPPITEVYNFPVQTCSGWIINQAIKQVSPELDWGPEGICFQVHDSLVLDGPDPVRLAEILLDKMVITLELNGFKARFPIDLAICGFTRDEKTDKLIWHGQSSWSPACDLTLDEIHKLKKGNGRLAA